MASSAEAMKLKQLTFNNLVSKDRDAADDVDPDDKDIDDGKIASKEDITIFTDSFINHGENVKSINAQAANERQSKLDKEGLDTYNSNDLNAGPSPYPLPSKKQKKSEKKKSTMIQDAVPVKKAEEKKPEPNQNLVEKKEKPTKDEIDNTNAWAHAEQREQKEANKEAESLQTSGLTKDQKSEIFHQISKSAFSELKDDADPSRVPKTDEQIKADRMKTASEVEEQTIDLDKHTFSANELKDFTALTEQSSDTTKAKMDKAESDRKSKIGEKAETQEKKKNMYEELYDNKPIDVKSA